MAAVGGSGGLPTAGGPRDLGPSSISAVHPNLHPSLHPGIHSAPLSSRAASSAGSSAHANPSEVPPIAKRPRMEMGGPIHHQGSHVSQPPPLHGQPSSQHASHIQSTSAITPLRIDTREAAKVKYKSIICIVTNVLIFRINLSLKQG